MQPFRKQPSLAPLARIIFCKNMRRGSNRPQNSLALKTTWLATAMLPDTCRRDGPRYPRNPSKIRLSFDFSGQAALLQSAGCKPRTSPSAKRPSYYFSFWVSRPHAPPSRTVTAACTQACAPVRILSRAVSDMCPGTAVWTHGTEGLTSSYLTIIILASRPENVGNTTHIMAHATFNFY